MSVATESTENWRQMLISVLVLHHQQTSINNWPTAGRRSSEGHFSFEKIFGQMLLSGFWIFRKSGSTQGQPPSHPLSTISQGRPIGFPIVRCPQIVPAPQVCPSMTSSCYFYRWMWPQAMIWWVPTWIIYIPYRGLVATHHRKGIGGKNSINGTCVFQCSDLQRAGSSPCVSILVI